MVRAGAPSSDRSRRRSPSKLHAPWRSSGWIVHPLWRVAHEAGRGRPGSIRQGVKHDAPDTATAAARERALDTVLADSSPASDPPPWTFGISPERAQPAEVSSRLMPAWHRRLATGVGVIDTVLGAVIVALLFPLLIVGVPLAFVWPAVLSATVWRGSEHGSL